MAPKDTDQVLKIFLTQDDLEEIALIRDPQEILDYLSMIVLSQVSDPLEAMSPICSSHETLH